MSWFLQERRRISACLKVTLRSTARKNSDFRGASSAGSDETEKDVCGGVLLPVMQVARISWLLVRLMIGAAYTEYARAGFGEPSGATRVRWCACLRVCG